MEAWGWDSPLGWSVFLLAAGATLYVVALAVRLLSDAAEKLSSLPAQKKK